MKFVWIAPVDVQLHAFSNDEGFLFANRDFKICEKETYVILWLSEMDVELPKFWFVPRYKNNLFVSLYRKGQNVLFKLHLHF